MEEFIFFVVSVSIIGIVFTFGFSFFKVHSNTSNTHGIANKNFNSFLTKIKNNSSKI